MDADLQKHEADLLSEGAVLISFVWPAKNEELVERLRARKVTVLAVDQVPRITRAQKMDALSSMSKHCRLSRGDRGGELLWALLHGADHGGRQGSSGEGADRRCGRGGIVGNWRGAQPRSDRAGVRYRPEVREQVQSMGADFLTVTIEEDGTGVGGYAKEMSPAFIEAEMALLAQQCREVDSLITTALIPGKLAPQLITQEMVNSMRPGSVIVDLAAEAGGNCAVTKPAEVVVHNGVTVIGFVDLPSRLAPTASQLYGTNLLHLLAEMGGGKSFHIDLENPIVRGRLSCTTERYCGRLRVLLRR